jgi:hypothetical protein
MRDDHRRAQMAVDVMVMAVADFAKVVGDFAKGALASLRKPAVFIDHGAYAHPRRAPERFQTR